MKYILRFGFIGDTITAIEASKLLKARLLICNSKRAFLTNKINKDYIKNIEVLSKKTSHGISFCNQQILRQIRDKDKNARFFLMTQSINLPNSIFAFLLKLLTGANVEILNEGTQTFYGAILRNKEQFITHFKNRRDDLINICIVWDGKEEQKNLNKKQINRFYEILCKKFKVASVKVIGKSKIEIKNPKIENLSGKTSLKEALEIIDMSNLVLSVDTGLLHYSVITKKPVIAVISHRLRLANWFPSSGPIALISNIDSKNKYSSVKSKENCILNDEINNEQISQNLTDLLKVI